MLGLMEIQCWLQQCLSWHSCFPSRHRMFRGIENMAQSLKLRKARDFLCSGNVGPLPCFLGAMNQIQKFCVQFASSVPSCRNPPCPAPDSLRSVLEVSFFLSLTFVLSYQYELEFSPKHAMPGMQLLPSYPVLVLWLIHSPALTIPSVMNFFKKI